MKKVFVLYIKSVNDLLILSAREEVLNEPKTVSHYEEQTISLKEVNDKCDELFEFLNSECARFRADKYVLDRFKHFGQSLFDQLFTLKVKNQLVSSKCEDMILQIDSNLVQIPWELLHNGENFLCQKFSIGRIVNTEKIIESDHIREPKIPFNILILADPRGDLEESRKEGEILFEKFKKLNNHKDFQQLFRIKLKIGHIKTEYIKKSLREFDIIHYAGHAKYDIKDPAKGGWQTADGGLLAKDITRMIGGAPLPYLIFSNACESGHTEPWHTRIQTDKEATFGLTSAFLLTGVQHYIGTFWKIPDKEGLSFAVNFYQNLLNGISIGKAIRKARLHLIKIYGEENITNMAYMLYGDPRYIYFKHDNFKHDNLRGGHNISDNMVDEVPSSSWPVETRKILESSYSGARTPINKTYLFRSWLARHLKAILSLFILALIMVVTYGLWEGKAPNGKAYINKTYSNYPLPRDPNEVDRLIEDIEKLYKEEGISQISSMENEWTSTPMTMAVFGYLSDEYMYLKESKKLYQINNELAREIVATIQNQKFIRLVDRRHLDKILKEHKFSLSYLAKNDKDLYRIGKAMGAQLLMFLELLPYKQRPKVAIDVVETDTTFKVVTFITPFEEKRKIMFFHRFLDSNKEYEAIIHRISEKVIKEIRYNYPLKGKITGIDNSNKVTIDLGSEVGLKHGEIMAVLGRNDEQEQIGRIEITKVIRNHAQGRVLEWKRPFEIGDKIIASPKN